MSDLFDLPNHRSSRVKQGLFQSDSVNLITELVNNPTDTIRNFYLLNQEGKLFSNYIPIGDPTVCCALNPDTLVLGGRGEDLIVQKIEDTESNDPIKDDCPIQLQNIEYSKGRMGSIKKIIYRGDETNRT